MNQQNLIIFDTTLRDGEQSPGASMTGDEKLQIAQSLEKAGVDVIEAGFAAASAGDLEAIANISKHIKRSKICSLARTLINDIDAAGAAIKNAAQSRIHTFIATSPIHMQYKLKMNQEQVLDAAITSIRHAHKYTDDIEFSCEDAVRSELDFLCRIIEAAIDAGASTINIPDTVGYALPHEFGQLITNLLTKIPNSDKAIFSVHCHNDLGLGVANSLAAVSAGARQVECTINGLGERAGNAALEEIVMAIKTRSDLINLTTNIDTTQIVPTSKLVAQITGFAVQPNKAIVGANAFAHEAGIHQDGILKHRNTYEIMTASEVGWHSNKIVLGKHSGKHALKQRLVELGVELVEEQLAEVFIKFKQLADKKHEIFDEDLHDLIHGCTHTNNNSYYELCNLQVVTAMNTEPSAKLELQIADKTYTSESTGSGPVDAVFKAIESIVASKTKLLLYSVNAITTGTEAQGQVSVRLEKDGDIVNGTGIDTDILISSAKAYIHALNLLWYRTNRRSV
jgi:2-isopropylmalate synthase